MNSAAFPGRIKIPAWLWTVLVLSGILIGPQSLYPRTTDVSDETYAAQDIPIIKNPRTPHRGEITLQLEEDLSIGSDLNEQEAFYKNISFTIDDTGNFFILDIGNDRIQKFSQSGEYLQTIGRSGQGPGDLNRPNFVFIGKDGTLYIYQPPSRLSLFDSNGHYLRAITFSSSPAFIARLGDSCFLGTTSQIMPQASRERIILFNAKGENVKTLAEFENENLLSVVGDQVIGAFQSFRPHLRCFRLNDDLGGFAFSGEYRIHIINSLGDTVRIIEKDEEPDKISEAEKSKVIENEIRLRRPKGLTLPTTEVKKAFVFPDHKPFFMDIISDDHARIYVLKYQDFQKDKRLGYDMFDAQGKFIYEVKISLATPVLPRFFKGSFLYAVALDKEGIYLAKRYRIVNRALLDSYGLRY